MKIKIESSTIIKSSFHGSCPPSPTQCTPLSVFDMISFNSHMAVIYAYRPPTPSTQTLKQGLQKALAVYPEWAGRLGKGDEGNLVVLLIDQGVRFIEASVDVMLDLVMPLKPTPDVLKLHPGLIGVEELLQVQITRFACGSMVIGFTAHHLVGDGQSASNFLVAWGKACRELEITPVPFRDRSILNPRDPPSYQFKHKGVEFTSRTENGSDSSSDEDNVKGDNPSRVVLHKVHFSKEFLGKLKAKASPSSKNGPFDKPYSTFECLMAHLWRAITKSRNLRESENTRIRISINGRSRLLSPSIAQSYFGNLVLWAYPSTAVKDLLSQPTSYGAKVIHDAISRVNTDYFRSFIDYANYKARQEKLVPMSYDNDVCLCPNLEVDCWLNIPFYDLDFGGGSPYIFMPSYLPYEGSMFLLPTYIGDGSIEAFLYLFEDNLAMFKEICYTID